MRGRVKSLVVLLSWSLLLSGAVTVASVVAPQVTPWLAPPAPAGAAGASGGGTWGVVEPRDTTKPWLFDAGMAFDATGNLYFAGNGQVWRRDPSGTITLYAGSAINNNLPNDGDGGLATDASLSLPEGLAVANGFLFIADYDHNRVRKVNMTDHKIYNFAYGGSPFGLEVDATGPTAHVFVSYYAYGGGGVTQFDQPAPVRICPSGRITTWAASVATSWAFAMPTGRSTSGITTPIGSASYASSSPPRPRRSSRGRCLLRPAGA